MTLIGLRDGEGTSKQGVDVFRIFLWRSRWVVGVW